ncbi:dynein axonemal intermediate chain 7 isoform X4 [Colius striatus]|uniref:dynein axonemal intermediate chain 7 isoform X4 n=1 Tax=Colius striatus TaxID=57412 RepID=UPI002B1E2F1E|nr:dynein axonemal intermediate chain 7 isoform X4 [Colius striatus]
MEALEAKNKERKEFELAELHSLEQKFLSAQQWKMDYRAHEKWEHYLRCDGRPDPTVLQEINTFMSLWREDQNEDIQLVMEKGGQVLNLIEKLHLLLLDTPPNEITEKETVQYQESILELQNLLHQKYNRATEKLLKTAHVHEDSDPGNMQAVIKDKNVTFCIWANLKKKVRLKNHTFSDVQHGFDLPKPLAVSSVAVRILHTHYDHVSPLWLQHQGVPKLEVSDGKELTLDSKDNIEVPEEDEEKSREPNMSAEEEMEEVCSDGRKSNILFEENSNSIADINETEEETEKKSEILDIPSQAQDPLVKEERSEKREAITGESIVDLQQFVPVGGVYHIDALQLPPQVKEIKDWSMVELQDGLESYSYPPEAAEDATCPPLQITLRLPDNVMYFEDPVIARWDAAGQQWRTDGISNITYARQEKSITFEMGAFYTVALFQNAHLNVPYQAWELQPTGTDEALLTVSTSFAVIQIQIKVSEHLTADSVKDKDWCLCMFNGQKAQKLKISETSEAFSDELEEGAEFHSTLYHMLKDFASKDAIAKVEAANFLFIDSVYQLLLATRVLTYS